MSGSSSMFTPLLTRQKLFSIFFVQMNEAYQIAVLLPMVVFMCRDFGVSPKWLGVYSSILNASFGICQFMVAYLWGYLSDKYGRRIILICGLIGTTVSMFVFGISSSFPMAMIARCFTGFANGNLGVVKAYLADITDSVNRGPAFGVIGCAFGAGIALGSMMGGILLNTNDVNDEDYEKTTSVLKFWIFEKQYPFLLPCLCGAVISAIALFLTIIFVVDYDRNIDAMNGNDNKDEEQFFQSNSITKPPVNGLLSVVAPTADIDVELSSALSDDSGYLQISKTSYSQKEEKKIHSSTNADEEKYAANIFISPRHQNIPTHQEFQSMFSSFNAEKGKLLSSSIISIDEHSTLKPRINSLHDMFVHTLLIHGLIQYGTVALAHIMFKEMLPVYMAQALLFDSTMIGYSQAFGGVSLSIFTVFCLGPMLRKYEYRWLDIVCVVQTSMLYLAIPSIYWLQPLSATFSDVSYFGNIYVAFVLVVIIETIFTPALNTVFVIATCYINNSVPFEHIGKANGIGQTVASFVRGMGPIITGFIWSESIDQIQNNSTHYAIYYAFIPSVLVVGISLLHIIIKVPVNLQLTWEQREKENTNHDG